MRAADARAAVAPAPRLLEMEEAEARSAVGAGADCGLVAALPGALVAIHRPAAFCWACSASITRCKCGVRRPLSWFVFMSPTIRIQARRRIARANDLGVG